MKSKKCLGWCCAVAVGSVLAPGVASAQTDSDIGRFTLKTSAFYTTGKYGRSTNTDILYLPLTVKYATGPWGFDLTVPYIRVTGPGNVIPDLGAVGTPSTTRRTESGLGDVRIGTSYRVLSAQAKTLAVDLSLKAKFGTADRAKGLGTGENDYSAQVDVQKVFGRLFTGGGFGYRVQGSPPGLKLRNVFYGEADVGYRFSRTDSVDLSFLASQASTANGSDRLLAAAYYKHAFTRSWATQLYALKGFSNGSPDYGGGLSLSYSFAGM